jgi:hypothetical protein
MNLIISGSVTSGYGIPPEIPRWDKVFRDHLSELLFETVCTDGMTHENALNILRNSKFNGNTLILYFGTRIGWPRIDNSFSRFFPYKVKNGGYLDLPVFKSVRNGAKMRRISRRISRILIKSLGILFKQYKPDLKWDLLNYERCREIFKYIPTGVDESLLNLDINKMSSCVVGVNITDLLKASRYVPTPSNVKFT